MNADDKKGKIAAMLVWIATATARMTDAVKKPFGEVAVQVNSMVWYTKMSNDDGWLAIVVGDKGVKNALLEIDSETRLQVSFEGPVDGSSGTSLVKQLVEYIGGGIRTTQGVEGDIIAWGEKNKDGSMKSDGLMFHIGALLADMKVNALTKGGDNLLKDIMQGAFSRPISLVSGVKRYIEPMEECAKMHVLHGILAGTAGYKALASWDDINLGDYLREDTDSYKAFKDLSLAQYCRTTDVSRFTFTIGQQAELAPLDDAKDFFDSIG